MTEQIRHGGTMVTISDDGTTEVVRDNLRVSVYASGQVVANWSRPRILLDAGPDDPKVRLVGADGNEQTMPSGFKPVDG